MDFVVQQVGAELRINDASGLDPEGQQQDDRNHRNKYIHDNQPVPQAPQQFTPETAPKSIQQVTRGNYRQVFQKSRSPRRAPNTR
jgi:hypothetical protein